MGARKVVLLSAATAVLLVAGLTLLVAMGSRTSVAPADTRPRRSLGAAFESSRRDAFAASVYSGLERVVRERGGRIEDEGTESSAKVTGIDLHCISSKAEGRDDEQILRALAAEGHDLVIATGGRFVPIVAGVARDFPRVRFALIGVPPGFRDATPNAVYIAFDTAEGAFLCGALAAKMTARVPNAKLGFVGGTDALEGHAYQAGFQAGAAYASPLFRKASAFLIKYCGRVEGAPFDQAAAESLASSHYKNGAALVFQAAGSAGRGVYAAARKAGKPAMGSLGEVPGDEVAAVVVSRGDEAVSLIVDELFASGTVKAGTRLLGVKEGAVGCVLDESAKDGPAAFASSIDALRALIASGDISVPSDDASAAAFIKSLN